MKKRLLAIALSLVMVIGLLPATALTINAVTTLNSQYDLEESVINLNNLKADGNGTDITVSTEGTTATVTQAALDTSNAEGDSHYLHQKNIFDRTSEEYIIQDIQIDKMPIFGTYTCSNGRIANGYFTLVSKRYDTANNTARYVWRISIYRVDEEGNLSVGISEADAGSITRLVPLGVKLGERFKLITHYTTDGKLEIFCNGVSKYASTGSVTFTNSNSAMNEALRIGYNSTGATAPANGDVSTLINIYSVSRGTKVAHVHTGGTASCTQQAVCTGCGESYGSASHTGGTATCTAKAVCTACGQAYGVLVDHTPNDEGVCTVCGTTVNYRDLSGATAGKNASGQFTQNKYNVTVNKSDLTVATTYYGEYVSVLKNVFPSIDVADHVSQTITINNMPTYSAANHTAAYSANGYYNNLRRNQRSVGGANKVDQVTYSIYPDSEGKLILFLYYSTNSDGIAIPLNKTMPASFRLDTIWHADGKVTFFCDGASLGTFANATEYEIGHQSSHQRSFTMGFSSYNAVAQAGATTVAVDMTVSNVVITNGHTEHDDGDCTTDNKCSVCGEVVTAAKTAHTPGEDDNNCATAVACTNPGCTKNAVEAKTHVAGQDDNNCATPVVCTNPGCTQNAIEANTHVAGQDDGDCTTPIYCTNPNCGEVAVAAKTHVAGQDDGDCTTAIKCTNTGCTQDAVAAKTHVAGQDDGDCTTAIKCTNTGCSQDAVAAKTHTGGTATCEKKAECTNCGKEYGDFAAHKPGDNGDCITGFTCTVCGDPVAATGSHTPAEDDGDCTTAIKCTVCGKETTAAKEAHTPAEDDGDCTTAVKCTVCGKETTAAKEAHTPAADDGDCTTAIKCTVCGKETTAAKEAHTEKVVNAKPATETEKGYTGDKVCSVCGKEIAKGQEIPVLEPAPTTPPATEPSTPDAPVVNPDTGDNGTAVYALLLAVSMMAMVALMVPDIRNKLIRK